MIETGLIPVLCVVTAAALFTEVATVNVIDLVAADTGFWCVFISLVYMAGGTGGFFMTVFQREIRFIVIEVGLFPVCRVVATAAFFTLFAIMHI